MADDKPQSDDTIKPGDVIECIDALFSNDRLLKGWRYVVESVNSLGFVQLFDGPERTGGWNPKRFRKVPPAEPAAQPADDKPNSEDTIKPGDVVECIDAKLSNGGLHEGQLYTVKSVNFRGWLQLIGKPHHSQGWLPRRFRKVPTVEPAAQPADDKPNSEDTIKPGDVVECIIGAGGAVSFGEDLLMGARYTVRAVDRLGYLQLAGVHGVVHEARFRKVPTVDTSKLVTGTVDLASRVAGTVDPAVLATGTVDVSEIRNTIERATPKVSPPIATIPNISSFYPDAHKEVPQRSYGVQGKTFDPTKLANITVLDPHSIAEVRSSLPPGYEIVCHSPYNMESDDGLTHGHYDVLIAGQHLRSTPGDIVSQVHFIFTDHLLDEGANIAAKTINSPFVRTAVLAPLGTAEPLCDPWIVGIWASKNDVQSDEKDARDRNLSYTRRIVGPTWIKSPPLIG